MHSGQLYDSSLCDLVDEQLRLLEKLYDFNATRPSQQEERQRLMKEMFGDIGKDCYIEPPLYSNWACKHVHFGDGVYANFSLTLVDDTHIYVVSHTMPNVTIPRLSETAQRDLRAIQRAGTHRRKLLDRRRRGHSSGRDDRGQHGHRRGQRGHARHPRERRRGRLAVQGDETDRREGRRGLFQRQKDPRGTQKAQITHTGAKKSGFEHQKPLFFASGDGKAHAYRVVIGIVLSVDSAYVIVKHAEDLWGEIFGQEDVVDRGVTVMVD